MTFQEYLDWHAWDMLINTGLAVPVMLIVWLGIALQGRDCKSCGRKLQRRWGKLSSPYASRWFCPFHDDASPYP